VAFSNATGQGGLQGTRFCYPANAVAARESAKMLHDRIPVLIKQKVNSKNGNNNHLLALRLSSPHEEINCVIQQTLQNRESYFDIRNKDILV
jgi:hypothetical protein